MPDALGLEGLPHFTDRLNQLVENHRCADGSRTYPTNQSIADALTDAGEPTSKTYVTLMRNGQSRNPTGRVLNALSRAFSIPVAYWFDEDISAQVISVLVRAQASRPASRS